MCVCSANVYHLLNYFFSDAKVQRLFWALIQTKRKGEEDLSVNNWYFTTLGIQDSFIDILPVMDNVQTGNYYAKSKSSFSFGKRCTLSGV